MLLGHPRLGVVLCSVLWGVFTIGSVFSFVFLTFGVTVWAAAAAEKSSEEVGGTLALRPQELWTWSPPTRRHRDRTLPFFP